MKDFCICFLFQSDDEHVVINVVIVDMFHPLLLSSKRTTKTRVESVDGFVTTLCREAKANESSQSRLSRSIRILHMGRKGFPSHPFSVIALMMRQVEADFMLGILNGSLDLCTLVNVSFHSFSMAEPCLELFQPCFDEVADLAIKLFRHRNINLTGSRLL